MSILGCTVYRWGGDVEAKVRLLNPHFVVVGSGCWNDLPAIAAACPRDCTFILRDMTEDLIAQDPERVSETIFRAASRNGLPYNRCVAHALNEQYTNAERARDWELRFITNCHDRGIRTVCLNLAYGNDPSPLFKPVADRTDLIGNHLYDGWIEGDPGDFVGRIHTSRRYAANWLNDYRHKIMSTEVGIESFPGTGQRRGHHDMGLSEVAVKDRMMANAMEWYADGLLGVCWFNAGHTEREWNEGYGMTELMARAWAKLPAPRKDDEGGDMALSKEDLERARVALREPFLNVQRVLNLAKTNASFEEQGKEIDGVFGVAGDGANEVDKVFADLAKKL